MSRRAVGPSVLGHQLVHDGRVVVPSCVGRGLGPAADAAVEGPNVCSATWPAISGDAEHAVFGGTGRGIGRAVRIPVARGVGDLAILPSSRMEIRLRSFWENIVRPYFYVICYKTRRRASGIEERASDFARDSKRVALWISGFRGPDFGHRKGPENSKLTQVWSLGPTPPI